MMNFPGGTSNISMPADLSFTRHGKPVAFMRASKSALVTTLGFGFCSSTSAHSSVVIGVVAISVGAAAVAAGAVGVVAIVVGAIVTDLDEDVVAIAVGAAAVAAGAVGVVAIVVGAIVTALEESLVEIAPAVAALAFSCAIRI